MTEDDRTGDPAATWDRAVRAVSAGTDPMEAARSVLSAMTPDERLWCLDGDLPFWAGLGDLGTGGYHKRPFPAARVERLGIPGFAFSDGPRGVVIGPATCFPVSMARGATWDVDLEERIGEAIGRELVRNGRVMRYAVPDDFGMPETAFLACEFWYMDALRQIGRNDEAHAMFEIVLAGRNHFGLLSEDIHPDTGVLWGNLPQTYSMAGVINTATRLSSPWEDAWARASS